MKGKKDKPVKRAAKLFNVSHKAAIRFLKEIQ